MSAANRRVYEDLPGFTRSTDDVLRPASRSSVIPGRKRITSWPENTRGDWGANPGFTLHAGAQLGPVLDLPAQPAGRPCDAQMRLKEVWRVKVLRLLIVPEKAGPAAQLQPQAPLMRQGTKRRQIQTVAPHPVTEMILRVLTRYG